MPKRIHDITDDQLLYLIDFYLPQIEDHITHVWFRIDDQVICDNCGVTMYRGDLPGVLRKKT
jgi:hypothetical protein